MTLVWHHVAHHRHQVLALREEGDREAGEKLGTAGAAIALRHIVGPGPSTSPGRHGGLGPPGRRAGSRRCGPGRCPPRSVPVTRRRSADRVAQWRAGPGGVHRVRAAAHLAEIRHPGQAHTAFALEGALQRLAGQPIGELGALRFRHVKAQYPVDDPAGDAHEPRERDTQRSQRYQRCR